MKTQYIRLIGCVSLAIGFTCLLCTMVFYMFGGYLFNGVNFELEPEQTVILSADMEANISIPGFETMTIPENQKTVQTTLYNPESNSCYFQISLVLESGEVIYQSKLVQPGQYLYEIELNRGLKQGEYKVTIVYETFSMENYAQLNGAKVPFQLIVQ